MIKPIIKFYPALFLLLLCFHCNAQKSTPAEAFRQLMADFDQGYAALDVPAPNFDFKTEIQAIGDLVHIDKQLAFFESMKTRLAQVNRTKLKAPNRLHYDHLDFELRMNLDRLAWEKAWRTQRPEPLPGDGLSQLPPGRYQYRIRFYTGVDITPEALFAFGEQEVARVKAEIKRLQGVLGYAADSAGFYRHLQSDTFYLTDKVEILRRYEEMNATVRKNLGKLFADTKISDIAFMEWPNAGPFTPPGYYSPATDNPYGTPVFHFNFHDGRHNRRAMDWLFIHEAIPGHHYQWWLRDQLPNQPAFKRHFYYPGHFEGWAAYVEYLGKDVGLYRDAWSELGKWEWDIVRSTRILIDVGIHHFGWTKEQAIACWKKHISGQDAIAEREVVRCTNWPAQALSYKVGAWKIEQMIAMLKKKHPKQFSLPAFHRAYLMTGQVPVEAVEKNIEALLLDK